MSDDVVILLSFGPQIDYPPFEKNFYNEHEELSCLTATQVFDLRHKLNLRVSMGFMYTCYTAQILHMW